QPPKLNPGERLGQSRNDGHLPRARSVRPLSNESHLTLKGNTVENVAEIVALLRKKAQLEAQILNGNGTPSACEQVLEAPRRRLASHPQALNAVLQTARALGRRPDAVSVQEVT